MKNVSRRQFLQAAMATTAGAAMLSPSAVYGHGNGELLLKAGRIVDGTNGKSFTGDILLKNGFIEAISETPIETSAPVMDCNGLIVSPGFIDIHAHTDWTLPMEDGESLLTPFTEQGITTFVGGNCGFGAGNFKKDSEHIDKIKIGFSRGFDLDWRTLEGYFERLRDNGLTHNLAELAGHGTTRTSIRGFDASGLSDAEMGLMLQLLGEAMDQGAHGVSFGLQYEPGVFATLDEMKAIGRIVKEREKTLAAHMKAYSVLSTAYPIELMGGDAHNILAVKDMIEVARQTGVRTQLSHLIFVGTKTWPNYEETLKVIDDAIEEGLDIKFDTYPYHLGMSVINVFLPPWFLADIPESFQSEGAREKLRREMTMMRMAVGFSYEDIQITYANHEDYNQYNGLFVNEIAEEMGTDPFDAFLELAEKSRGRARVLNHKYSNPEIVHALIKHPASLFMTDALVAPTGVQNPAAFGTYPRFLEMIRENNLIPLEEAIYKMSGGVAERYDFGKRGTLKEGYAADVTVFDWETVADNITVRETDAQPSGIKAVFINGERIVNNEGEADPDKKAGQIIKA